jgi:methylmalonyl-CoA mutase
LKDQGLEDVLVVVGGVIPPDDYDFLYRSGVRAIFGPGTRIPAAAQEILSKVKRQDPEKVQEGTG